MTAVEYVLLAVAALVVIVEVKFWIGMDLRFRRMDALITSLDASCVQVETSLRDLGIAAESLVE